MGTIIRSASCPNSLNKIKIKRNFKRVPNVRIINRQVLLDIYDDDDKFEDFYMFMAEKGKENYLDFTYDVLNFETAEASKRATKDPFNEAQKIWAKYICEIGKNAININQKTRVSVTNKLLPENDRKRQTYVHVDFFSVVIREVELILRRDFLPRYLDSKK